jgi:hypothetical protein
MNKLLSESTLSSAIFSAYSPSAQNQHTHQKENEFIDVL